MVCITVPWVSPISLLALRPGPVQEGRLPTRGYRRAVAVCSLTTVWTVSPGHTHLCSRAAWIDKCRPNLLITESTYATTIH